MITFDPPLKIKLPNKLLTIKDLPLIIIDIQKKKICKVQAAPFYKTLTLWEDADYDAIGDYTQKQAEDRFLELLGSNPEEELSKLYVEQIVPKPTPTPSTGA